jgi:protein TonB
MFEDSLIESGNRLKTKRGRTSTIAFIVQILIIGVMILIPLMFTEALPKAMTMTFLAAPLRP